jgi:hypothetical protein
LAPAARPPGRRVPRLSAPSILTSNEGVGESDGDELNPTPGYQDEGISLYIEDWAPRLGDNDLQRSVDQAHHLWWTSKLPRGRFHNAMKAALHETEKHRAVGKIQGAPIKYFFATLRTTASDQCRREGLPPLKETREEQRERVPLGGMTDKDLELAATLDGLKSADQVEHSALGPAKRRRKTTDDAELAAFFEAEAAAS